MNDALIREPVAHAGLVIQHPPVRAPAATQWQVSVAAVLTHYFSQVAVKIGSNFHIRIGDALPIFEKEIRQGQRNRIPRTLDNLQVQAAFTSNARLIIAIESFQLRLDS